MVAVTPGAHNVFVHDHEASSRMVVDFSRNINKFKVNQYAQIWPAKKTAGLYLVMGLEEAARVVNTDESLWADGADRPVDFGALEDFEFLPFRTKRHAYSFPLGDLTVEQATWDIMAQHLDYQAKKAMTTRTIKVQQQLQDPTKHLASHVKDADDFDGVAGDWGAATTQNQNIKRTLGQITERILLDTLGAVTREDLIIVIGPGGANRLSQAQEFVDHVKGSPDSYAQVRGELKGLNTQYQMPDNLYGMKLVVEDTVRVTNRKGAAKATSFVLGNDKAIVVSRVGGLEGVADAPSFSSVVQFMKEEMTVEKVREAIHRRTTGSVVEDFEAKLVAPVSSYLIEDLFS